MVRGREQQPGHAAGNDGSHYQNYYPAPVKGRHRARRLHAEFIANVHTVIRPRYSGVKAIGCAHSPSRMQKAHPV